MAGWLGGMGVGLLTFSPLSSFPALGEAHSPGWVGRGWSGRLVDPLRAEGQPLSPTLPSQSPRVAGAPFISASRDPRLRSRAFPGMWCRPAEGWAAVRPLRGGFSRSPCRGSWGLCTSLVFPSLSQPGSSDDFVTRLPGASVVWRVSPLLLLSCQCVAPTGSRGFPGFSFHQRLHQPGTKTGKMKRGKEREGQACVCIHTPG